MQDGGEEGEEEEEVTDAQKTLFLSPARNELSFICNNNETYVTPVVLALLSVEHDLREEKRRKNLTKCIPIPVK